MPDLVPAHFQAAGAHSKQLPGTARSSCSSTSSQAPAPCGQARCAALPPPAEQRLLWSSAGLGCPSGLRAPCSCFHAWQTVSPAAWTSRGDAGSCRRLHVLQASSQHADAGKGIPPAEGPQPTPPPPPPPHTHTPCRWRCRVQVAKSILLILQETSEGRIAWRCP